MTIFCQEALKDRARALHTDPDHNGIRMVLVSIDGDHALLEVHFYNRNFFDEMESFASSDPSAPRQLFPISGGRRLPAGDEVGQVQVISVDVDDTQPVMILTVSPIGDYSTYRLGIDTMDTIISSESFDPLFSEIDFKFRPGCFGIDCDPEWKAAPAPKDNPAIDYLAKDYHSFKHTMIVAMSQRVPGWQPSSEADLDQVLLEIFCVAADELSDYQDRVMNEAYLGTARKRVSLARHARLMDYHIHQGNQASTWLAAKLQCPMALPGPNDAELTAWAGNENVDGASAVVFMSHTEPHMHFYFNQLGLYTWSDAIPSLAAGSTSADLQPLYEDGSPISNEGSANAVRKMICSGGFQHLLIQEWLNPATGRVAGRDPGKRQLLKLLPNDQGAEVLQDPITEEWFVRVRWERTDALKANYCFVIDCQGRKINNVSMFHGNLVPVFHGRPASSIFKDPTEPLLAENEYHFEGTESWGTICRLPSGPLAYKETPIGGEIPPRSTLNVEVVSGETSDPWEEVISLVHSDGSAESGDHFIVETDEDCQSLLRFGNGKNGRNLPEGAEVHCHYQIGYGPDGNIGADTLKYFDSLDFPEIIECWNPFDVTSGRAPEPVAEIIRRVPEAYRYRQLRAITLQDYVNRAEELPEVARAAARYAWTGSWRTVQVAIDPLGTHEFGAELRWKVARHLEAVRLTGEDLEIRGPKFVPLCIDVVVCIHPDYWAEDVRFLLEQEFSEGYTPDSRRAFFHPDLWTFGQRLYTSEIVGRIQLIEGVDHVVSVSLKRWGKAAPGRSNSIDVRANEIIRVRNDPDHMEDGFMNFTIGGGRE